MARLIAFPFKQTRDKEPASQWPRLLTLSQAATYCGLNTAAFLKACPVQPISMDSDPDCERYDKHELDSWIDAKPAKSEPSSAWQKWLALMGGKIS